jgi:hypothetical protein
MVIAAARHARPEPKLAAAHGRAFHLGARDRGRGLHRGEVLAHEPGLLAPRTNILDANRRARDDGQGQGAAQDLAAALALGAVDGLERGHAHPFTHTTWRRV